MNDEDPFEEKLDSPPESEAPEFDAREPLLTAEEPSPLEPPPAPEKTAFSPSPATHDPIHVPPDHSFSVLIEGHLSERDKTRLLDFISKENLDIREVDLEHQFDSGSILLPRLSEFAGVKIIQTLRDSKTQIRFGPSDQVFQSQSLTPDLGFHSHLPPEIRILRQDPVAKEIPATTHSNLPGFETHEVVDSMVVSGALKTLQVQAELSSEYQESLDRLIDEIKRRAAYRGAEALIHLRTELTTLQWPTDYRLTVSAVAIRKNPSITQS